MTRNFVNLDKKNETFLKFRKMKLDRVFEGHKESRIEFREELGHEMSMANRSKEKPKTLYTYIKDKSEDYSGIKE